MKGGKLMNKYIPYTKLGKKAQKKFNKERREEWSIQPITKVIPSKKVYDRKKANRIMTNNIY